MVPYTPIRDRSIASNSMAKTQGMSTGSTTGAGERSVTPLYHQVYVVLRERILGNEYDPELPLPGEHQLAEEFAVSRVTIRRTLKNLELDGLVSRVRGVGTYPIPRPAELRDRYNTGGLLDPNGLHNEKIQTRTLSMGSIDCPPTIASRFAREIEQVYHVQRVRASGQGPFTLLNVYLPLDVADCLDKRVLRHKPVISLVEEHGPTLVRTEQSISARLADDAIAGALEMPTGSALITINTVFADREDVIQVVMEGFFRPDRYEYRTTMVRQGSEKSARWKPLL